MRKTLEQAASVAASLAVVGVVCAGPAMAATASRPGSYAVSSVAAVYSTDTLDDGRFVSTVYLPGAGGAERSLVNQSGPNTQVSRSDAGVNYVKACISRPALPMACTAWNAHL